MERATCAFCHAECSLRNIKIKGDRKNPYYICYDCYKKTGFTDFTKITDMTVDSLKPYMDEAHLSDRRSAVFRANEYVCGFIEADGRRQYWRLSGKALNNDNAVLLFSDIKSFSVSANGEIIGYDDIIKRLKNGEHIIGEIKPKLSGIFRTPKCESLFISIESGSLIAKNSRISLITKPIKISSAQFGDAVQSADECAGFLQSMIERGKISREDDEELLDDE